MTPLRTTEPRSVLGSGQEGVDAVVVALRTTTRTTEGRTAGADATIQNADPEIQARDVPGALQIDHIVQADEVVIVVKFKWKGTHQPQREATMKAEAGNYKILHFATHAILDDRNPLYSHIILSRTENDMHEDGLMEAWEIMKLDLNAELAVLSACQTARGRIAAGEGIIGMSWALFVAGTPAAIVSQWKVDSARSSELMIEFHRNLLGKRGTGKTRPTKSEALRQAALKVFRSSYNHPAYWAGFILIGEDN